MEYKDYIFKQNPWFIDHKSIKQDQYLVSLSSEKFVWENTEFLNYKFRSGVYIVTGMRQIGKTTHLKMLIDKKINNQNKQNFFYFNCDLINNKKEIVDIVGFYLNEIADKHRKIYLILDEITSVPDGILAIKYLIDSGYKNNIVYILSGSSSINFKKTGEFLPGRRGQGKDFVFHPLTFAEYLELKYPQKSVAIRQILRKEKRIELAYQEIKTIIRLSSEINKYLISGGIPKIINTFEQKNTIPVSQFQSYLSWIKSEIAKNKKDEFYVKSILERIKQSLSAELSYNSISQETGIGSHNTIYSYLRFLEDSFVINQLYNYDFSQKKLQKKKNKKIYFNDPFVYWLASFWINFGVVPDFGELDNNVDKSKLIENIVEIFLRRRFSDQLYFYKSNYEIDFITKKIAYEIKYQNKISNNDIKAITKFPGEKIIISKTTLKIENKLKIIPLELFLLM